MALKSRWTLLLIDSYDTVSHARVPIPRSRPDTAGLIRAGPNLWGSAHKSNWYLSGPRGGNGQSPAEQSRPLDAARWSNRVMV